MPNRPEWQSPQPGCAAAYEWRLRPERTRLQPTTALMPCEQKPGWSAVSHPSPIPMQKLLTKEKRHQPYAAQENPERHLMALQCDQSGSPGVSPGGRPGLMKHLLPSFHTLDPHCENCP